MNIGNDVNLKHLAVDERLIRWLKWDLPSSWSPVWFFVNSYGTLRACGPDGPMWKSDF